MSTDSADSVLPLSVLMEVRVLEHSLGLCPGKTLRLKCAQRGCAHVYNSFSGLRKHLTKCSLRDNSSVNESSSSA